MNDTTNAERLAKIVAEEIASVSSYTCQADFEQKWKAEVDHIYEKVLHAITTALEQQKEKANRLVGRWLATADELYKSAAYGPSFDAIANKAQADSFKQASKELAATTEEKQDSPNGGNTDAAGSATVQGQATLQAVKNWIADSGEHKSYCAAVCGSDGEHWYEHDRCDCGRNELLAQIETLISSASTTPQAAQPLGKDVAVGNSATGANPLVSSPAHEAMRDLAESHLDMRIKFREVLRKIKLTCLTDADAANALAHVVRLCIDAGIDESLEELQRPKPNQSAHEAREGERP